MTVKLSTLFKIGIIWLLLYSSTLISDLGLNLSFLNFLDMFIPIGLFLICRLNRNIYEAIYPYVRRINWFLDIYIIFYIIEIVFTIFNYSLTGRYIYYVYRQSCHLLYILLIHPMIYIAVDDEGIHKLYRWVLGIGLADGIIRTLSYLAYSFAGITLSSSAVESMTSNMRRGKYRLGHGRYHTLVWDNALSKVALNYRGRILYLFITVWFFLYQIFISQGRSQLLCYIIVLATFVYFAFLVDTRYVKVYRFMLILILAFSAYCMMGNDVVAEFFDSFFSTSTSSEYAGSAIARIYAVTYYWGKFKDSPFLGMGLLFDDNFLNGTLYKIMRGTSVAYAEVAHFEDLGLLGQIFNFGIIGGGLFLFLLIRWSYITIRVNQEGNREAFIFLLPLIIHGWTQCISSMSLFQSTSLIYVPIYMLVFEYYYHETMKNREENSAEDIYSEYEKAGTV